MYKPSISTNRSGKGYGGGLIRGSRITWGLPFTSWQFVLCCEGRSESEYFGPPCSVAGRDQSLHPHCYSSEFLGRHSALINPSRKNFNPFSTKRRILFSLPAWGSVGSEIWNYPCLLHKIGKSVFPLILWIIFYQEMDYIFSSHLEHVYSFCFQLCNCDI